LTAKGEMMLSIVAQKTDICDLAMLKRHIPAFFKQTSLHASFS
jgi:hypothetical protein